MSNLNKSIKNYDARLNWVFTYSSYSRSKNNLEKIPEEPSKINISALIRTLNKTNKIFKINFFGIEPFLIPNIIEAWIEITKSHFISFKTRLTSSKIKEFTEKIDPKRIIAIFASVHIEELERLKLLDNFVENFNLCKEKGFNIKTIVVAHPQLFDRVEKYIEFFSKNGIKLNFTPFIGNYNGKVYPKSYNEKEIEVFNLNRESFYIRHRKGDLCNAGFNTGLVKSNGNIQCCYQVSKIIGNIYKGIKFKKKMIRCPFKYCRSPGNRQNLKLFKKAENEMNNLFYLFSYISFSIKNLLKFIYEILNILTIRRRMIPNFMIIGGLKCGTTSLFNYLKENPSVGPPLKKEPHFFNMNYERGFKWYKNFFPPLIEKFFNNIVLRRRFITGEATPFIFFKDGPKRVYKYLPHIKIIILLRNPVDRIYSEYQHFLRLGIEKQSFKEVIEMEYKKLLTHKEKDFFSYNPHPYLSRGIYLKQIKNWLKYIPINRILIIKSEDFFDNPAKILEQVSKFLNIRLYIPHNFRKFNVGTYSKMDDEMRKWLIEFYKPYNERLYKFLDRKFDWNE